MATKAGFKTVETDLEEIENKIKEHRRKIFRRVIIAIGIIAVLVIAYKLWAALRTYSSFEVRNTIEEGDKSAVSFVNFSGYIVEYSNDGIVCIDTDGELVWNQSFEMTAPKVDICGKYLVVYDAGGTGLFIINSSGSKQEIEIPLPIKTACVANQGTVAVLMKDGNNSYVQLYDKEGNSLAKGEFFGEKGNIPIDIALSHDAKKLAVDMVDMTSGSVNSVISFYNFGTVGQGEIDNNVGTYTYEDLLIPEIDYISSNKMVAVGDSEILVFEGSEKPELKNEIKLETEVDDVFFNEDYIGVAYSNNDEECTSHIKVFNYSGKTIMENNTKLVYTKIEFNANNEVCITNDQECEIYTMHSIKKFSYKFDDKLYKILYEGGENNYIFVYDGYVDEVKLK